MALYQISVTTIQEVNDVSELQDSNGHLTLEAWDDLKQEVPKITPLLSSDEVDELVDLGVSEAQRGHRPEIGIENKLLGFPNLTHDQRFKLVAMIYSWLD